MIELRGIILCLVSFAIVAYTTITRPTRVQCPPGWWANGVRPSGATTCIRNVDRDDADEIDTHVYCSNGSRPIVSDRDGRTVGCQRRFDNAR